MFKGVGLSLLRSVLVASLEFMYVLFPPRTMSTHVKIENPNIFHYNRLRDKLQEIMSSQISKKARKVKADRQ